jgi:hypothetical protein
MLLAFLYKVHIKDVASLFPRSILIHPALPSHNNLNAGSQFIMKVFSVGLVLATISSGVFSAAIQERAVSISSLPTKAVRCGGRDPRSEIHSTADIKKAAEAALNHVIAKTQVGKLQFHESRKEE